MKLVLDSPPLQALHRCSALPLLQTAYEGVFVPNAVQRESHGYFEKDGGKRVPDLGAYPWILVDPVSEEDLMAAGAAFVGKYRETTRHRFMGRTIDRPELEVVLSAGRQKATAVLEDKQGMACARDRGVSLTGTAQILCALEDRGLLPSAATCAKAILATGYFALDLRVLSHGNRLSTWRIE